MKNESIVAKIIQQKQAISIALESVSVPYLPYINRYSLFLNLPIIALKFLSYYSVLSATTGSFLDAFFAGIRPAKIVRSILIMTSIIAPTQGRTALMLEKPESAWIIAFTGKQKSMVKTIPIMPAATPMIKVSALNTREISFLEAPMALSMPISFVLSRTEILVIIPIIIEDTTSEIETNAIRT
jgi:hypothetical protein